MIFRGWELGLGQSDLNILSYSAPQYVGISPGCTINLTMMNVCFIHIRYYKHTWDSFQFDNSPTCIQHAPTFILRETYDRSQIQFQLTCRGQVYETKYCTNYGKFLQAYQFCTTINSQTYVHPWPSHPCTHVDHPVPDLFSLWFYNEHHSSPPDVGVSLWVFVSI